MNILVLIKQVPATSDIGMDEETGVILRDAGETKMNPYDLYALEIALRIREQQGGRVAVLSMGPPAAESTVREAFMMGADSGFLMSDRAFAGSDVLATSYALSQAVEVTGPWDLIITGKQTTDGDTAQVGVECSEFLSIPCMTNVQLVAHIDKTSVVVESDMGGHVERSRVKLPALIAVEKDICQPRLPSYRKKKATAEKKVLKLTLKDLTDSDSSHYGLDGSPTKVINVFPPDRKESHEIWVGDNLGSRLYTLLKQEKYFQERQ